MAAQWYFRLDDLRANMMLAAGGFLLRFRGSDVRMAMPIGLCEACQLTTPLFLHAYVMRKPQQNDKFCLCAKTYKYIPFYFCGSHLISYDDDGRTGRIYFTT